MKRYIKHFIQYLLGKLAQKIVRKYKPRVIGITGSVGKTSTTQAVYAVLSAEFRVRKNISTYNNEIGIPLSVIGCESGGSSALRWLVILFRGIRLVLVRDKHYPQFLVLEMGADRPGDIKYLTEMVPLETGIVTHVSETHVEFFGSIEKIAREKSHVVRKLPKSGYAILNFDDNNVLEMKKMTAANVVTFGTNPEADFCAKNISISNEVDYEHFTKIKGVSFKLVYKGSTVPVLLPNVLGGHLVYSALAAMATGVSYGINLHTIIEALKTFEPPKGRMHLISGIKQTVIIDDTYNSSPLSCKKAIEELRELKLSGTAKKYAVLGDMLELGLLTEKAHHDIGKEVAKSGIDFLICVGEMSRDIIRGATKAGMDKNYCFHFATSEEAGMFLQQRITSGDVVLVKGSQRIRMEKIVKEIMAEPQRANELLVRQDKLWLKKK